MYMTYYFTFSPCTSVSSSNKTDRHDIPEILLKVTLNITTLTLTHIILYVTYRVKLTDKD